MKNLSVAIFFAVLSVCYLYPGFSPVFNGDTSQVMSDGTDAATLPYQYGVLLEAMRERPADLFFGAVPARHLNSPEGYPLWIPWSERAIVLFWSFFTPLEHLSTVYAGTIMLLNALCMYALGRLMGWSRAVALAMAIAWAFCPFTRGRAQVHVGFAGTYHIPLAMLSLFWATRGKVLSAVFGFLAVAMAPHYFVITLVALSPLFLLATWAYRPWEKRGWLHLGVAVLPMIALLAWCYLKPLPAQLLESGLAGHPPSGQTAGSDAHEFLTRFAARPIDYLTGDIALGPEDINPARGTLSDWVYEDMGYSNPHERANGIRWFVCGLAILSLIFWQAERRFKIAVLLLGAVAFWLSLGGAGPAYWLYSLVSQIRVPSRAGIFVNFAAILLAGTFLRGWNGRWLIVLPMIAILELPPFLQGMRVFPVRPRLQSLSTESCGTGMYYPYVAGNWGVLQSYYFQQEMRESRCGILNRVWPTEFSERMYQRMGLTTDRLNAINSGRDGVNEDLKHFAKCVPLSWIVFDPQTSAAARIGLCTELGWQMTEPRVCKGPNLPLVRKPAECI